MAEKDIKPITWPSLILEFSYSLIGRGIPGCLFIIGLIYVLVSDETIFKFLSNQSITFKFLLNQSITLMEPCMVQKYDPPYAFIFILLMIGSYASGLILSFIGDWLGRIFYIHRQYRKMLENFPDIQVWLWKLGGFTEPLPKNWESKDSKCWFKKYCIKIRRKIKKICNKIKCSPENSDSYYWFEISNKECDILFQRQHDHVKQEYAQQARSLSQSEAEGQLCINTSAAFFLLSLVSALSRKQWIIFFVIAIFTLIAARYRNKRFLMRQFSFSAEIKKREENPEKPKNKNGE